MRMRGYNAKTEPHELKSCVKMEFKNGVLAVAGIGQSFHHTLLMMAATYTHQ